MRAPRPRRWPGCRPGRGCAPARYVGEEVPGERVLVFTIHDGDKIPRGLPDRGSDALYESAAVRHAYRHERDWSNRLIAGDSLLVMNSLLRRELMAGKVQMIYVDPPYGVKFSSNFQPRIDRHWFTRGWCHTGWFECSLTSREINTIW